MANNKYVKLTQIDHILLRPDTYVGSVNTEKKEMFVVDDISLNDIRVVKKMVDYNPGFLKIFDEILSNASDASIRTGKVKTIKINIDSEKVSVENDGPSIPVVLHTEENVYNSELIFSHLLTGENYDDTEQRYVSGKNGYGAKLCNVFSTKFIVDNCDGKKKFKQIVKENMKNISTPIIKDVEKGTKSYTKITYYPEVSRFGLKNITNDSISLMMKRCLDVAVYNSNVRVVVNGKTIPVKSVKDFMKMHIDEETEFFYEKLASGWEIGIAKSSSGVFEQVSIVNGTSTYRGGTQVSYIGNQLSKDICDKFNKKVSTNWADVKNKIFLFVISQIPNPEFDTQTKENLTNYMSKEITGGSFVGDNTVKKIMKSEIVESILHEMELKEKARLKRLQKANQKVKVEKLVDANSKDRSKCQLFIFEGESAGESGRNFREPKTQGLFKLKGKFANTRKLSDKKIIETPEVSGLMASIGLILNEPVDFDNLRYDEIIISTDADIDGDSITGLLINFFSKWKELFIEKKIYKCLTPILVLKKGKQKKYFYSNDEWIEYQNKNSISGWEAEYKKGLGSLEDDEYKEIIQNPKKVLIEWDDDSEKMLECWFGTNTELRKNELEG